MAERTHTPLTRGAAEEAPTAPHATPREPDEAGKRQPRTGPERFWDPRRARLVFGATLALSIAGHYALDPIHLFPQSFRMNDTDGEATLPIDVLDDDGDPAPVVAPPAGATAANPNANGGDGAQPGAQAADASVPLPPKLDAGPDSALDDAGDGGPDAAESADASVPDPLALANALKAGDPLVLLVINMDAIKRHPVGQNLGAFLSAIPQWDDFMSGTGIDPVRDGDWVMISGPSLRDTTKDIILVHYSAPDEVVDHAMDVVAAKWAEGGGPYDAGVPQVRAVIGHADGAPRVFLQPQSHLMAVVPVSVAHANAALLARTRTKWPVVPGVAFSMRLLYPQHVFPDLPAQVTVVRLRVVPNADGSADVFAEGDCATPEEAKDATDKIGHTIQGFANSFVVRLLSKGLLDSASVTASGTQVKVTMHATLEQLQALMTLLTGQIQSLKNGAPLAIPGAPAAVPAPPAPPVPPPAARSPCASRAASLTGSVRACAVGGDLARGSANFAAPCSALFSLSPVPR